MSAWWRIRGEVSHGARPRRGWRFAWYEPRRRVAVYFPAPLHWLMRAARELVHRMRLACEAPTIECAEIFRMQRAHRERQRLAEEYSRGYLVGWHECFRDCLSVVEEELSRPHELLDVAALLLPGDKPQRGN